MTNHAEAPTAPAAIQQDVSAILLVNDDPGALFALRTVLSDLDTAIVTATSCEQALLRLLKQDFCVILMDVQMAGLDGFETARLVRQRQRSRDTLATFSDQVTRVAREVGVEGRQLATWSTTSTS